MAEVKKTLRDKARLLPDSPGVYIFRGEKAEVLYIGKAKSLKKRVASYFGRYLGTKTQAMVSKVRGIGFVVTASEKQAILLESSLIKENQPPYNLDLKDDKSFPLVKITREDFPLVSICWSRSARKDKKSFYFGPYLSSSVLRQALKALREIFGFRSCRNMPKRPCLYYRLDLCPAPCAGKISKEEYGKLIKGIKAFLRDGYEALKQELCAQMKRASQLHQYEEAAGIRDRIRSLELLVYEDGGFYGKGEAGELEVALGLSAPPERIEAFDISNISGSLATGSMVSFYKGSADKSQYRRFRIRSVNRIDDYAMIREVVRRRYSRLRSEAKKLPDLVVIDGGKGHLFAARDELFRLGLQVPVISIAKEKENVYTGTQERPVRFRPESPGLKLLCRIRDEAHRFALSYHRLLRNKKVQDG